ncbi:unnamed protein product [Adineta steineri]|uniref:Diacylglycerol kinase n=2 Tax=Adineta steineri TaxID=433720 RepID=A0A813NZK7_9BILA|nr:unnamed protein product [Adineta steineri]
MREASESFTNGVDWSNSAEPTSHCWLHYSCETSSASRLCACILCKNRKSTSDFPLIQCATCLLIVHATHLSELEESTTNTHHTIPPCRPSFVDNNIAENVDMHDQHYWSHVSTLSAPCTYCKRKSSDGLVCMWCSRGYHRQCWETIEDNEGNSKCDYGKFSNIIVRPQWLRRVVDSPFGFRAQMPAYVEINDTSLTPVIFFINKLSGGQKGQEVYRMLVRILNPRQVFLLENDSTITRALNIYASLTNTRICICGGDGTVGWVLSHLVDTFPALQNPPASILPLGTGNDLSRVLCWGYQYASEQLLKTLLQIPQAHPMVLDRWKIHIETLDTNSSNDESLNRHRSFFSFIDHPKFIQNADQPIYENHHTPINMFFFNYISFGLDAAVVLDFHAHRTRDPSKFTSPLKNKLIFIKESRKYFNEFAFGVAWNLSSYIRLICDDQDMTESIRHCHSLVLLNTRGFGAGTHPWGGTSVSTVPSQTIDHSNDDSSNHDVAHSTVNHFEAQNFGDEKIEVLGLNTMQMALIHIGFRGTRIAQCRQVRIELNHPMPAHMDGEAFYLARSTAINITHAGQVMVLRNDNR